MTNVSYVATLPCIEAVSIDSASQTSLGRRRRLKALWFQVVNNGWSMRWILLASLCIIAGLNMCATIAVWNEEKIKNNTEVDNNSFN